jgi:hypothetical protein
MKVLSGLSVNLKVLEMAKQSNVKVHVAKPKVKRPGVHAKCKASKLKGSKNYLKIYKGQG